jgi:hypothetical protein
VRRAQTPHGSRHIASKLSSYRLTPNPICLIQGYNLRGACPNLTSKLNAVPGVPLEKQTSGQSTRVGTSPR